VIASVAVVMTIFPALFAAVLVLGSHVAAEALSPPRLLGQRLLGRAAGPALFAGWLAGIAALLLVTVGFGVVALFFSLLPNPHGA
jgi:hypothetical protein